LKQENKTEENEKGLCFKLVGVPSSSSFFFFFCKKEEEGECVVAID
jgi:hypothetical protein